MRPVSSRQRGVVWVVWLVAALLFLMVGNLVLFGVAVPASALLVALIPGMLPPGVRHRDRRDLVMVGVLYLVVVALMVAAFQVFTTDRTLGLFLCFAAALLTGTVGPILYTVWGRARPLSDLGLRLDNWRAALGLGLLLAAVQFALTLYGTALPADPVEWVPLVGMALMVGLFEAIFFRGFLQGVLTTALGPTPGVGIAAALYALYHVGYGMGAGEMLFLFGLGVVYGVAYATVTNVLVLWPLLIPMGSFFNNLQSRGFELPWASLLGFADVLALMATAIVLGHRRQLRTERAGGLPPSNHDLPSAGSSARPRSTMIGR